MSSHSDFLTLEELLDALKEQGVDCKERTVRFWMSKGLLEKPLRKPFRYADGRVRYFPRKVVSEILEICRLQEEGWKISQIKKRLRSPKPEPGESLEQRLAHKFLKDLLALGEFRHRKRILSAEGSSSEWSLIRKYLIARLSSLIDQKIAAQEVTKFLLGLSRRESNKLRRLVLSSKSLRSQERSEVNPVSGELSAILSSRPTPEWGEDGPEPVLSRRLRNLVERLCVDGGAEDLAKLRSLRGQLKETIEFLSDDV